MNILWKYLSKFISNKTIVVCLGIFHCLTLAAVISYDQTDISFNTITTTDYLPNNILGLFGSTIADIYMQIFGILSLPLIVALIYITFAAAFKTSNRDLLSRQSWWILLIKVILACVITLLCCTLLRFIIDDIEYISTNINLGFVAILIYQKFFMHKLYGLITIAIFTIAYFVYIFIKFISRYHARKTMSGMQSLGDYNVAQQENYGSAAEYHKSNNKMKHCVVDNHNHASTAQGANFTLPSIELLNNSTNLNYKPESLAQLRVNAEALLKVLNDFGINGTVVNIHQGPVITLYEFEPAAGIKASRIIGLADDIARSLHAMSARIASIPGRNVLGIELPNKHRMFFNIKELLATDAYNNKSVILPIILGKDVNGKTYIVDLAHMPHLLVAGTTGSGKSVAINTMILSLLYRFRPDECKFIMIDPKMLELSVYSDIPHLLTPVVTDSTKAVNALKWAVKEMENRYKVMSNVGVRNITGYNSKIEDALRQGKSLSKTVQVGFDKETQEPIYEDMEIASTKLPLIVLIVDEMADLMLVAGKDIEISIQRLAQMARAAGIHIIMATQRPSVDVITGVIKANFPSRISFKVTSKIDSRTILGQMGSEQLLGMGDMLYMGNASQITRVHGPFVDDSEVERVVGFLKSQMKPKYITAILDDADESVDFAHGSDGAQDLLYAKALEIILKDHKVSISYLQRCLRIGYNRAALLIEKMEHNKIITPPNHVGKREILITRSPE